MRPEPVGDQRRVRSADTLDAFLDARQRFFAQYGSRWPGALADPFDLLEPLELSAEDVQEIEVATAGIGAIYRRVLPILHGLPDESLIAMGVRRDVLELSRTSIPGLAVPLIARIDLAHAPGGIKLLEYNGESPGLVVETFGLNALACADVRQRDVNAQGHRVLSNALCDVVSLCAEYVGHQGEPGVVAFSYSLGSARDRAAAEYFAELLGDTPRFPAVVVPIESVHARRRGLFLADGRPVRVLCPSCPVCFLGAALSASKLPSDECSAIVVDLVRERRLALINAPDASLLTCKATQAVIWGLVQKGLHFSDAEADLIRTYFLPTFLDPPSTGDSYVIKPAFGREGDSITIVDSAHDAIRRSPCSSYRGDSDVYQTYVALPEARMMTEKGTRNLRLVTSCFLVAGHAVGIIVRAGEEITDDEAWVVPVSAGSLP